MGKANVLGMGHAGEFHNKFHNMIMNLSQLEKEKMTPSIHACREPGRRDRSGSRSIYSNFALVSRAWPSGIPVKCWK